MILTRVKNEVGATAIEYGLLASLIAVSAIGGMSAVGVNLSNTYCTISKHLGGSETCLGATSSNSSGTGNVSWAANLQKSLSDPLYLSYVDKSQGGTASVYKEGWANNEWCVPTQYANAGDTLTLQDEQAQMEKINAKDPITNVFGIYNQATGDPITDYNSVLSGINKRVNTDQSSISSYYKLIPNAFSNQGGDIEVTTQSGKVYTISGDQATESK